MVDSEGHAQPPQQDPSSMPRRPDTLGYDRPKKKIACVLEPRSACAPRQEFDPGKKHEAEKNAANGRSAGRIRGTQGGESDEEREFRETSRPSRNEGFSSILAAGQRRNTKPSRIQYREWDVEELQCARATAPRLFCYPNRLIAEYKNRDWKEGTEAPSANRTAGTAALRVRQQQGKNQGAL